MYSIFDRLKFGRRIHAFVKWSLRMLLFGCGIHMNRKIYPINFVMFIPLYFSDLSNGFKLCLNKFKLRRHGIANQSIFRCSLWFDETAKRRRNCKCHYFFI